MHTKDAYTIQLQNGNQMNLNCFDNIGLTDQAKSSQNEFLFGDLVPVTLSYTSSP